MCYFSLFLVCLAAFNTGALSMPPSLSGQASAVRSKRTLVTTSQENTPATYCTNYTNYTLNTAFEDQIAYNDTKIILSAMENNKTFNITNWNPDSSYAPLAGWHSATFGVSWTHGEFQSVL